MIGDIILWTGAFIAGYLIIFYAVDIFLDNLKNLCIVYNISAIIMGSLILGIDVEESIASIIAAINGLPYIAIGNVIGNSIIALTLCFALPALFYHLKFKAIPQFYFWVPYICLLIILLGFFISFGLLIAGFIAILIYIMYFIWNFRHFHEKEQLENRLEVEILSEKDREIEKKPERLKRKMILLVIVSFLFIVLGGELLIYSATELIFLTGISESIFGFVIIAFVTNVEELTLIIKSIKKKSIEIGMGGMMGKLIWNMTIVFGISGMILMNIVFNWDLLWNSIILLFVILLINVIMRKKSLNRKDGILLMSIFVGFLIINFI